MDPDVLFLIALGAFWLLQQLAAKRRKQQAASQRPAPGERLEGQNEPDDVELDDALAEIRRALGMEGPAATPAPRPASPPQLPERPQEPFAARPTRAGARRPSDEFHRVDTGRPDAEDRFERRARVQYGAEDRFESRRSVGTSYDEPFERTAPYRAMPSTTEDRFESGPTRFTDPLRGHTHAARDKTKPEEQDAAEAGTKREPRLRGARLRDAFILSEILGPPRSQRRSIR